MSQQFDAIVIGSGLGGLTAGALYARAGHKVLVLERSHNFGGAATVYQHGALAVEASLHEIDGLDGDDPKTPTLQFLGLDRDIPFVDVGDLHEVRSPLLSMPFVLPHGLDAALAAMKQRFPRHLKGLNGYFKRIIAIRRAVVMLSAHQDDVAWWLRHALTLPWRLWPLIRNRHTTLSEVFQHFFGDDEAIKLILASNIAYYTDDPDTMPFIAFAIPQASFLLGGGHYIRGGSQVLSDRLVAIVRETGGQAESGRDVDAILLEGNHVRSVRHCAHGTNDSREDFAPLVFGNAAPSALAAMLPEEMRTAFNAPFQGRHLSISLWAISLGLNRPSREFGVQRYSTAIFPGWVTALNHVRESGGLLRENPGTRMVPYGFVAYDQIDSGLNQNGPYLLSMVGVDRLENWDNSNADEKRMRKERWMDRIIADLDSQFPGIAGAVVQREMSTAETFHHYLNTPGGAVYGFSPQTRGFMPMTKTAIGGLYLASAYTGGGGFTGAILGGSWAARAAMKAQLIRPNTTKPA